MNVRTLLFALIVVAAPLAVSSSTAGSPTVSVTMDGETYSPTTTLTGTPPVASILVLDGEGAPAANAQVRVVFLRQVQFVGFVSNETVVTTTGLDGTVDVPAPTLSRAPGTYLVVAFALGSLGSDNYAVRA